MKKLMILLILVAQAWVSMAQTASIDKFVRKYKRGANEKIDLTIPGFLVRFGMNFVDDDDLEGVDVRRFARKIDELRIAHLEGIRPIEKADFDELLSNVRSERFEELMTVREKGGERVHLLVREKGDFIRDFLLLVNDDNTELTILTFSGKFTMNDINKMLENVNFNGDSRKSGKTVRTVRD
jgi:hypothetical protein